MLARQLVLRLPQIHRRVAFLLVEVEQLLRQAETHAQPLKLTALAHAYVESLRLPVAQTHQQRREMLPRLRLRVQALRRLLLERFLLLARPLHAALEVVLQLLQRAAAVAHTLHVGMCRDAHDARAAQLREVAVEELLRDDPGNHVTGRARALAQLASHGLLADAALQTHLHHAVHVRQRLVLLHRPQQNEETVRRRVAEQLQVVGTVLVVAGDVERPHALQEGLAELVVAEERVAVDREQLALVGVRRSRHQSVRRRRTVQTQERIQPLLHGIARRVPNRLLQLDLLQQLPRYASPPGRKPTAGVLLAQLVEQLQRERAAGALVAGDGGGEHDDVRPQQRLRQRQGNGGRLVHEQQLRLRELRRLGRRDVLDGLSVRLEHVHAQRHVLLARRVNHLVVLVVLRLTPHASPTRYFSAFRPRTQKSKAVCRFSGDGAVTKIDEYPNAIAPAIVRPSDADLPYVSSSRQDYAAARRRQRERGLQRLLRQHVQQAVDGRRLVHRATFPRETAQYLRVRQRRRFRGSVLRLRVQLRVHRLQILR